MNVVALAGIVVGFGLCVVLPIVAVLAEHQRKMARILHGRPEDSDEGLRAIAGAGQTDAVLHELQALRSEVANLRSDVASLARHTPEEPDLVRRNLAQKG